jgi:Flp pilus assembly protein TadG
MVKIKSCLIERGSGRRVERFIRAAVSEFFCSIRGSAIIEFAFIAPIFIFLIIFTFELAIVFTIQNALEAAVREAARYSITGRQDTFGSRQAAIIANIKNDAVLYSGGMINPSNLQINVAAYGNFSSIGAPESFDDTNRNGRWDRGEPFDDINSNGIWDADQGISGSYGTAGQVVLYTVKYQWRFAVPLPNNLTTVTLTAQTPAENESF